MTQPSSRRWEYPLLRSRRKTVGIYMKPDGGFEVRAPLRMPKAAVDAFVRSKARWIAEKEAVLKARAQERRQAAAQFPHSLPLLGAASPVFPGFPAALTAEGFRLPGPQPEEARAQAASLYNALARREIPARTALWSQRLGLVPVSVGIGSARTSWGSCSGRNVLRFSWRLMAASPACIDYVVIHELCHIAEHNHSPRFWALVAAACPDWRARREELRAVAQELARLGL